MLGLSFCTAVASAGEVHFNLIGTIARSRTPPFAAPLKHDPHDRVSLSACVAGVLFMASASCSDALRLVVAQRMLRNQKMNPIETLYYISPICMRHTAGSKPGPWTQRVCC